MKSSALVPDSAADAVAHQFVSARLGGRSLQSFPGSIPADLKSAYVCQEAAIAAWPERLRGWKIGRIAPELSPSLGADRLAGPIFEVWRAEPNEVVEFPIFVGGFAAVEAELVIEIVRRVEPEKRSWTPAEAASLIRELFAGIETAGSPLATINDLGPTVVVSDFGNNAGLILGPPIVGWRGREPGALRTETFVDGKSVGRGSAAALPGGPLGALMFLLSSLAERGRALEPGDLVSTGATTGIHSVSVGQRGRVVFDGEVELECIAKAAGPRA